MVLPCSKDGNEDINYRREYGEPIPPSYNLDYVLVVVLQHLTLDNSIAPPFNLDKAKKKIMPNNVKEDLKKDFGSH